MMFTVPDDITALYLIGTVTATDKDEGIELYSAL